MPSGPVAIIDIGSNSIKVLVATRLASGQVHPLKTRSIDARISAGISRAEPRLGAEGMARGVEAVTRLVEVANRYGAGRIILVATSAVRDAANGAEFRERIRAATGHEVRLLTGGEEANLIGRGLTTDPALGELRNFYVFDLGGGSLECLAFRERRIEQAHSLPLGCVRLSERFATDLTAPFSAEAQAAVAAHTRAVLAQSGFAFTLPAGAIAIGTGGTVTTLRAILGARIGRKWEETSSTVTIEEARDVLAGLGALPLAERKRVPGLPEARADVFPTALATLIAVAECGGFAAYRHSKHNLRFGLADEALA